MKRIFRILLVLVCSLGCKAQQNDFQQMASQVKSYFMKNVPDIKRIDSIYMLVDTVTPQLRWIMQSVEYGYAATMAKKSGSSQSDVFDFQEDSVFSYSIGADDASFLYFRVRPLVFYTKRDNAAGMGEKWFFFDRSFNTVEKYSFVTRISDWDNNELRIEDYAPLTSAEHSGMIALGVLIYYYR